METGPQAWHQRILQQRTVLRPMAAVGDPMAVVGGPKVAAEDLERPPLYLRPCFSTAAEAALWTYFPLRLAQPTRSQL